MSKIFWVYNLGSRPRRRRRRRIAMASSSKDHVPSAIGANGGNPAEIASEIPLAIQVRLQSLTVSGDSEWGGEHLNGIQVSFGFGYHPSATDYKLIRIVLYSSPSRDLNIRADLHVMSTDSWAEINVNKLSLFFGEMDEWGEHESLGQIVGSCASAVLNGVFYWPARVVPTDEMVVMSFDMGNEVFRRIRTPECLDRTSDLTYLNFTELDDKLAVVIVSPHERCFDVWVLNENESSFTNQVKVGSLPRIASDMEDGVDFACKVVGDGKNGKLLMTGYKYCTDELKLFSYDTKTRQTMDLCCAQVYYGSCVFFMRGLYFQSCKPMK